MAGKDFDNTNRGSIWRNEKKETDKHPDFTGSLNVDGKDYWVSAWKRKPDASERAPALSFSVKLKDGAAPKQDSGARQPLKPELDDEIPFSPEFR
jgi:hypothetical protein